VIVAIVISVIEEQFNLRHLSSGQHSAILIIAMSVRVVHSDKSRVCSIGQHSATLIIAASSKELPKSRNRSIGQCIEILLKVALVTGESSVPHLKVVFHLNFSMASNFVFQQPSYQQIFW
jgi:hypothetical protein